jgi:hypothetical protein
MKKQLKKLSLNKKQVSQLTQDAVVGGSTLCTFLCGNNDPVETIDLTHCWGNYICEFRTSI